MQMRRGYSTLHGQVFSQDACPLPLQPNPLAVMVHISALLWLYSTSIHVDIFICSCGPSPPSQQPAPSLQAKQGRQCADMREGHSTWAEGEGGVGDAYCRGSLSSCVKLQGRMLVFLPAQQGVMPGSMKIPKAGVSLGLGRLPQSFDESECFDALEGSLVIATWMGSLSSCVMLQGRMLVFLPAVPGVRPGRGEGPNI